MDVRSDPHAQSLRIDATDPPAEMTVPEMREYVAYLRARCQELLRIVAKVAGGDFSEKPDIVERDDEMSQFVVGFRFMIEDLERAQDDEAERRRMLEEANARLRELNELRVQFINNAAHELNTPLTPLLTELYVLRQVVTAAGALDAKESIALLERNAERMARLVGDLLESARLQTNRLDVESKVVDMAHVCGDVIQSFRAAAAQADLTLEAHIENGLHVRGDTRRLGQVLFNLVSNAIKFTPPGGHVVVDAYPDGDRVVFKVKDTGMGLSSEQQARLFQAFTRVHEQANGPRGNGLGLFISKGLLELHQGAITCESEGPGQGSTFTVTLPKAPSPETRS